LWGFCVAYHFSFLCCVFCFSIMTSYTNTHPSDPPQTKTKHTTQKTKMISNTEPQQTFTILGFCVVCFVFVCGGSGGWVSVLLVILVFCVVCFVFVCGGSVLPEN
jgi:hypothetical protein